MLLENSTSNMRNWLQQDNLNFIGDIKVAILLDTKLSLKHESLSRLKKPSRLAGIQDVDTCFFKLKVTVKKVLLGTSLKKTLIFVKFL